MCVRECMGGRLGSMGSLTIFAAAFGGNVPGANRPCKFGKATNGNYKAAGWVWGGGGSEVNNCVNAFV